MASLGISIKWMLLMALSVIPFPAWGQSSADFTVVSGTFNSGGVPGNGPPPASASYRVRMAALGETVAAAHLSSASFSMDIGFVASSRLTAVLFSDGFESGDTSSWTSTAGRSPRADRSSGEGRSELEATPARSISRAPIVKEAGRIASSPK